MRKLHKFFIGKPPGYPSNKLSKITNFGNKIENIGYSFEIIQGSYNGEGISEANIDSHIIAFLTGSILIPHIYKDYFIASVNNKVTEAIQYQAREYIKDKKNNIFLLSGDGDFIPILQQIGEYSQEKIGIYVVSNPKITHNDMKVLFPFLSIDDVMDKEIEEGNNLIIVDGNNFLNGLAQGNYIKDREDYDKAFDLLEQITIKLTSSKD